MEKTQKVLCGLKVGVHSKNREDILNELRERVLGAGYDIIYLRPQSLDYLSQEDYGKITAFLAENGIRFYFGFKEQMKFQQKNPDMDCQFEQETVQRLRKAGGEYFLGNCCSEPGTATACNFAGYSSLYGVRIYRCSLCHWNFMTHIPYWVYWLVSSSNKAQLSRFPVQFSLFFS